MRPSYWAAADPTSDRFIRTIAARGAVLFLVDADVRGAWTRTRTPFAMIA